MGQKRVDRDQDPSPQPSLELPTLKLPGLGRRRKPEPPAPTIESTEQGAVLPTERVTVGSGEHAPADAPPQRRAARRRSSVRRRVLPAALAVLLTGLVVGLAGTGLTYLGLVGCEALNGTSTCGGPGLFLLVATLASMVLLGILMLKAWQVSEPGSTSFLAVGVVAVVVLLVLLDVIFSAWMFVVVPVLGAASYALSHWVTTRFGEEPRSG